MELVRTAKVYGLILQWVFVYSSFRCTFNLVIKVRSPAKFRGWRKDLRLTVRPCRSQGQKMFQVLHESVFN
jgi:hypothetical protein